MKERYVISEFPVSFELLAIYQELAKICDDPLEAIGNMVYECYIAGSVTVDAVFLREILEELKLLPEENLSGFVFINPGLSALVDHVNTVIQKHTAQLVGWHLAGVNLILPATIDLYYLKK